MSVNDSYNFLNIFPCPIPSNSVTQCGTVETRIELNNCLDGILWKQMTFRHGWYLLHCGKTHLPEVPIRHSCLEIRNTAHINKISRLGLSHATDRSDFPPSPCPAKSQEVETTAWKGEGLETHFLRSSSLRFFHLSWTASLISCRLAVGFSLRTSALASFSNRAAGDSGALMARLLIRS